MILRSTCRMGGVSSAAVLVVDPHISSQSSLIRRILLERLQVLIAPDKEIAKKLIRNEKISHAITELRFEEGDGFEVLESLRLYQPRCRTIVHTSYCNIPIAVRAAKAGACDVLPKPMDAAFVVNVLLDKDILLETAMSGIQPPNAVREEHIRQVFLSSGSNIRRTAARLSMHRRTLQKIMKRNPSLRTFSE